MTEQTPCLTGDLRTPGKRRAPQRHMARLAAAPGSYPSPNYSSRNGTTVTGIVIHTAEGPTDADALGAYFAQAKVQVSSHAGADDTKRVNYVDPVFEAWTLRNGNPWTDNLEMCGFASWTRTQWLQHPGMIGQAAEWVAERCHARDVPPRQITATDIAAGRRTGYFAHWDYTRGTGDGTHWDVGSNFPWDIFAGLVQNAYNGTPQEDDMPLTPADEAAIKQWGSLVEAVAQRERQILIDGSKGWSLTHLQQITESTDTRVAAIGQAVAKLGDPAAIAAELAKLLPKGTAPTDAQVLNAMRTLLGIPEADAPAT